MLTRENMRQSEVPHIAAFLSQMVGEGRYLMPLSLLPKADCPNCIYSKMEHDGAHCYMFRESPGERCGQMTKE